MNCLVQPLKNKKEDLYLIKEGTKRKKIKKFNKIIGSDIQPYVINITKKKKNKTVMEHYEEIKNWIKGSKKVIYISDSFDYETTNFLAKLCTKYKKIFIIYTVS